MTPPFCGAKMYECLCADTKTNVLRLPRLEGVLAMPERLRQAKRRTVGMKETLKAVQSREAKLVYLAQDAEDRVTEPIRSIATTHSIPVIEVESMETLGRICGIEVGAAAAALL